mgnify:CR=1 FL=1
MYDILAKINDIAWSMPLVILVVGAGIYFSIRMRFPQFRYFKEMIHIMSSGNDSEHGLSPLKTFIFTAARSVGVGNIAGMATAIYFGGPGSIFWLWILALVGSAVAMVEAILAQTYRVKELGEYRGGPAYYMSKGIKNKTLGKIMGGVYAVVTVIGVAFLMSGVQSYNIAHGFEDAIGIPYKIAGVVLAVLMGFVIMGGLKRIGDTAKMISPFMAIVYIIMTLIIVICNIEKLPGVIALIFKSAFGADQMFGAILGSAVTMGIRRGVFANEVGIGTSAITGAVSEIANPVMQGLTNALSVFIGTFFVCTPSAIMMLMTGCYNVSDGKGGLLFEGLPGVGYGNGFVSAAINSVIPGIGNIFVAIAIFCFAFVALLAYYLYSESNLLYLFKNNKMAVNVLRILFVAAILVGSLLSADTIWTMGDIANAFMAWINVAALIILGNLGIRIFKDYDKQKKSGVDVPVFDPKKLGLGEECETWINKK